MEQRELRRRLLIARAAGRFENREELAAAIDEDGLGEAVLGQIERGERTARPRDLKAIADACRVPHALLLDETYDPFSDRRDPEPGFPPAVLLALEELLERRGSHSAALEELRQLRQSDLPANGRSAGGRD